MRRTSLIAWSIGACGFVTARWLEAVCNVPGLCAWLTRISWWLGALCTLAYLRLPAGSRFPVLSRRGADLLALTCALDLVVAVTGAVGVELPWRTLLVAGLDLLAWGWVLYGAPAVARWLSRHGPGTPTVVARYPARRHSLLSVAIVLILGLQVAVFFKDRPTFWPFIDYPLYSSAHGTPIRAQHYRLYGLTAHVPPTFVEISAEALGTSWFVHHTQFIPRLFDRQPRAIEELEAFLRESDLPAFRRILSEHTLFLLEDGELREFPERRWVESGSTPPVAGTALSERPTVGLIPPVPSR